MLNKVTVIGRLGRDPELRTFQDGGKVTNVTVATTEKWKDKNSGEMKEHTEWHKVSFSGRLAEIASDYLQKGSLVYVEGSLRTPPRQNRCRSHKNLKQGALMEEQVGQIRTSIQG